MEGTIMIDPSHAKHIIGSRGMKIKSLKSTHRVQIELPGKDQCDNYQRNGQRAPVILRGAAADVQNAINDIATLLKTNVSDLLGGGQFNSGGFGGAASGPAQGISGGLAAWIYIFRNHPQRNELQLMLQQQNSGLWDVPNVQVANGQDCNAEVLAYLQRSCGAGDPPFAQLKPVENPFPIGPKMLFHLTLPQDGGWLNWDPAPKSSQPIGQNMLTLGGKPQEIKSFHTWVDVGALQADRTNQQLGEAISNWMREQCDTRMVPKAQANLQQSPMGTINTQTARVTPVAGSSSKTPAPPNWQTTPVGMQYAENLRAICNSMAGLGDASSFVDVMGKCFHPDDLKQVFGKWKAAGYPNLPHVL
eukprot:m.6172 g.6172  ORF g.6172 m.6172 type:complete len:360 (+) comp3493_c0_seq2:136-1215(+)